MCYGERRLRLKTGLMLTVAYFCRSLGV